MKIIEKEANDLNLALCGRKKNSHEQYTYGKNGHPDIIKTCQLENSALAFSPYLTGKGKKMAFIEPRNKSIAIDFKRLS